MLGTSSPNDPKENIVRINFQRVFNEGNVENVMALFEDETNVILKERELEKEKTRKETEMESITAILKQGPETFRDFIDATNSVLDEVVKSIDKLAFTQIIDQLFRDLHSLKGFARVLELNTMADKLHKFENIFSMIRNNEKPVDLEIKDSIIQFTEDLTEERKNIKRLLELILSFNRFNSNAGESKSKVLLNNFIISLKDMVDSISNDLGKDIAFKSIATVDDFPYLNKLRNAIIHLIRNSVDHGIEDKFERMTVNKNQKGTIIFKLHKDKENYFIEIIDDGGGLNFDIIKKKAVEKYKIADGNIPVSKKELVKLIFSSDFSSRDTVTDISGRGLGLNIVKKDVERLNGKISISTSKGRGTKFTLTIPADADKIADPLFTASSIA
jgi:chemotaxis protein histidine kinase CheA